MIDEINNATQAELNALKQLLAKSDYIACKIAEGSATVDEYHDIILKRQEWRIKINQLEEML